ncbi:MAG: GIY-YIG nuclease family protein [Chryseolinea sp.]
MRTRLWEHRSNQSEKSFCARYNVHDLIYYEAFNNIDEAIRKENHIKGKKRSWKESLIAGENPSWQDLQMHFATD